MTVDHPTQLDMPSIQKLDNAMTTLQGAMKHRNATDQQRALQRVHGLLKDFRVEVALCQVHIGSWRTAYEELLIEKEELEEKLRADELKGEGEQ